jgi:hypothetical protein
MCHWSDVSPHSPGLSGRDEGKGGGRCCTCLGRSTDIVGCSKGAISMIGSHPPLYGDFLHLGRSHR